MDSNNILNFQESTTILNARTKKSDNLFNVPRIKTNRDMPFNYVQKKNKLMQKSYVKTRFGIK